MLGKEQIKLLPETHKYLYTQYTPLRVQYRKGSRSFLEKIIVKTASKAKDDQDKVIMLMNWCVNIEKNFPTRERNAESGFYRSLDDFLWGGTEEEVIKKGSDWCGEIARVFCILNQIAGFPARIVYLYHVSEPQAHAVGEVYVESKWSLFDVLSQKYYPKKDGTIANAWELRENPSLIDEQTEASKIYYADRNFYRNICIVNYFVQDFAKYDYSWDVCNDHYRKILAEKW